MTKRILIVDDEETSRKILSIALEGKDRELIFAVNGEEAVEKALKEKPDLIIMDIDLPRMNGYEAATKIKSTEGFADVPLVAVTARTVKFSAEMAKEAGCDDYVTKPYRLNFIREKMAPFL